MAYCFLVTGGNAKTRIEKAQQQVKILLGKKTDNFWQNPDIFLFEEENTIKINQIRELKKKLILKPYNLKFKIALLVDAEKMTIAAQNALLKTLEEPPANSIIILLSANLERLLPTIISRAQIITLPIKDEKGPEFQEEIDRNIQIAKKVITSGLGERLVFSEILIKKGPKPVDLVTDQLYTWRKILLGKAGLQSLTPPFNELSLPQIMTTVVNLEKTRLLLEHQVNPRLAIENLFMTYPKLEIPNA